MATSLPPTNPTPPNPAPSQATPATTRPPAAEDDPFDTLLTLEDQYYTAGYNEGLADGEAAGRSEGRQLGLERGFQRFAESGLLRGRAIVWANRLRQQQQQQQQRQQAVPSSEKQGGGSGQLRLGEEQRGEQQQQVCRLPPLPDNPRLARHVSVLHALVDTDTLSTENTDEAVDEFDDRLRRARGRVKIIERIVGESGGTSGLSKSQERKEDASGRNGG
ncbi:hypothetical protein VTJ49DRAFT_5926 [Mycothermus thermophilus]|uniref:Essential protein Yae1 N-terminal domain-containing protein n=1 Tax=Humicola insolens TaxID=85995 RepID=A0ABR3VJT4_HUMIN